MWRMLHRHHNHRLGYLPTRISQFTSPFNPRGDGALRSDDHTTNKSRLLMMSNEEPEAVINIITVSIIRHHSYDTPRIAGSKYTTITEVFVCFPLEIVTDAWTGWTRWPHPRGCYAVSRCEAPRLPCTVDFTIFPF